jgi:hypothetical protein
MAITTASLKAKLIAELNVQLGAPTDSALMAKVCEAIAKAVKDEITGNAVVSGTVTSGAGSGGTVTGTVG